jgi:di/tricarboxylate transporter
MAMNMPRSSISYNLGPTDSFVQTGLGDRVATFFVKILGKSTLGLSYGLTISEALLAPAMPSTTARAGGRALQLELPDC